MRYPITRNTNIKCSLSCEVPSPISSDVISYAVANVVTRKVKQNHCRNRIRRTIEKETSYKRSEGKILENMAEVVIRKREGNKYSRGRRGVKQQ